MERKCRHCGEPVEPDEFEPGYWVHEEGSIACDPDEFHGQPDGVYERDGGTFAEVAA